MEFAKLQTDTKKKYLINIDKSLNDSYSESFDEEKLKKYRSKIDMLIKEINKVDSNDSHSESIENNEIKFGKKNSPREYNDSLLFPLRLSDSKETSSEITNPKDTKQFKNVNTFEEYSDDYLYKKPWTKLSNIHKTIKIKEYIGKLLIDNSEDRDRLKDTLVNLLNKKILTKKDMVKYDNMKGIIISIPKLVFKENKYYFDINH